MPSTTAGKERLESAATLLMVVVALLVGGSVLYRQFAGGKTVSALELPAPGLVEGWEEILNAGILVGNKKAPVKVIEFADFECPYCRMFDSTMHGVRRDLGEQFAFIYVHFPLDQHRFARPAARASECAQAQGSFSEFARVVYSGQDSLGLKSWADFAVEAGLRDTAGFLKCVKSNSSFARIEDGVRIGKKFGVRGTPTVIINGWRFAAPPADSILRAAIVSAAKGERLGTVK